jgi:hypothetical protein
MANLPAGPQRDRGLTNCLYMSVPPENYEAVCLYCEKTFIPTPGWKEGLYCCKEHRFACDEKKSVGYVERECELKEEILPDDFDAGTFYDQVDHVVHVAAPLIAELDDALAEKILAFFAGWLELSPPLRDAAALRLAGKRGKEVAKLLGVSDQAVSKNLFSAAKRLPALGMLVKESKRTPERFRRLPALGTLVNESKRKRARNKQSKRKLREIGETGPSEGPTLRSGSPSPRLFTTNEISKIGVVVSETRNELEPNGEALSYA